MTCHRTLISLLRYLNNRIKFKQYNNIWFFLIRAKLGETKYLVYNVGFTETYIDCYQVRFLVIYFPYVIVFIIYYYLKRRISLKD